MAGLYQDAPSRRMAPDVDGTVGVQGLIGGAMSDISAANMAIVNDESNNGWLVSVTGSGARYFVWLFPELRELDGIFYAYMSGAARSTPTLVESAANTTNGIDGTWTSRIANITDYGTTYDKFRDNITSLAVPTEKGIRVTMTTGAGGLGIQSCHLYGIISAGETPDRILFLDPDNADATFTKPLDYGEVPRGQTTTGTFKVKNNSATKTINTIQVTAEDLYLNAGGWYTFGDDAVNYQATFAVGNLGPGATKLVYLKQVIPNAETLGLQTGRIKASHASVT